MPDLNNCIPVLKAHTIALGEENMSCCQCADITEVLFLGLIFFLNHITAPASTCLLLSINIPACVCNEDLNTEPELGCHVIS